MTGLSAAGPLLGERRWPQRTLRRAPRWCSLDLCSVLRREPLASRLSCVERLAAAGVQVVDLGDPASREEDFALCRALAEQGPGSVAFQVRVRTSAKALGRVQQASAGLGRVIWHWLPGDADDLRAGLAWLREVASPSQEPVALKVSAPGLHAEDSVAAQRICRLAEQVWQADEAHPLILSMGPSQVPVWPHVYADLVERLVGLAPAGVTVSVTPSNGLGTAVASAALALLAGAAEVQGTLLVQRDLPDLGVLGRNLQAAGLVSDLATVAWQSRDNADEVQAVSRVLQQAYGLRLPPPLSREFQRGLGGAMPDSADALWRRFKREYLSPSGPFSCGDYDLRRVDGRLRLSAGFVYNSRPIAAEGKGVGPLSAFVDAVNRGLSLALRVLDYREHARGEGDDVEAVAFVQLMMGDRGPFFGCGIDHDMTVASFQAVAAAVNRSFQLAQPDS